MSEEKFVVKEVQEFHVVTVGWDHGLVEQLGNAIAAKTLHRFSHMVHPKYTVDNWPQRSPQAGIHFFRDRLDQVMPEADRQLLSSLERNGVPSLHNMILGDRVVSKLPYLDALRYATFLAQRLIDCFVEIKPTVVIIGFDSIHGSLALATARYLNVPSYALHFSVIPSAMACFCDRMTPAARVVIEERPAAELLVLADRSLRQFEDREIRAHAYIAPAPRSIFEGAMQFPQRLLAVFHTIRNSRQHKFLQYTEKRNSYSLRSAGTYLFRKARARGAIRKIPIVDVPPDAPFVLFGFHMQPESSIDVWAPFFSNQKWVVELLSRSIPPTHKLLVKIHKSDIANYSRADFKRILELPGVELVAPFADTRSFIERASLLIAIQGTIGLEGALLGKPVIMLGESPVNFFPSAEVAATLRDLPSLVRKMLAATPPSRNDIISAYAEFLAPFFPASKNDWTAELGGEAIDGYAAMFNSLKTYVESRDQLMPQTTLAKVKR